MKQEVRRGRKFIEYHDPETQPEGTFTQEISGADVSYQETDGSWHPADENWETDGADGFILKNEKLNHKFRLKGNGGRTWYPRRNVNTEYITFGVPQYRNGTKWSNFRFSGWSVEGKTITLQTRQGVTILVHNRWNGIKIDWVLASSAAPSRMRYPVALTGITESEGVLRGADGVELGRLTPTTATDSSVDERGMPTQLPCSGSYMNGYVEFQADVTGAVYPVTIDPDFSSESGGDNFGLVTDKTRNAGAASSLWQYGAGVILIRFILSSIGATNTCTAASLSLTKINSSASDPTADTVHVYEITSANGDWIEGTGSGGTEAKSGESCYKCKKSDGAGGTLEAWAGSEGLNTANTDYVNTSLGSTVCDNDDAQYTVYTWTFNASGIAVVEGWFGEATNSGLLLRYPATHSGWTPQVASSEHATASYRPKMTVTYTAAATGTLRRTNMNAQMSNLTGGMHG